MSVPPAEQVCPTAISRPRVYRLAPVGFRRAGASRCARRLSPSGCFDEHGSLDRVKDVSRGLRCVPLLGVQGTSAVAGAVARAGESRTSSETDRPRSPFRQDPAKSHGFQAIRMPSTVDSKSKLELVSRSRHPHVFPRLGKVLFGYCKRTFDANASRCAFERASAFCERYPRLSLTTQARQRAHRAWPLVED